MLGVTATVPSAAICPEVSPWFTTSLRPRAPSEPLPQHLMTSVTSTAQVCKSPVPIANTLAPTLIARRLSPISSVASPRLFEPSEPSRPLLPFPKHFIERLSRSTQVCEPPAAAAHTLRAVPSAIAGNASPNSFAASPRLSVAPVPNRPLPPLPKHFIDRSSSTTHVCDEPRASATAVRPVPRLTVVVATKPEAAPTDVLAPRPNCPDELSPQHVTCPESSRAHV